MCSWLFLTWGYNKDPTETLGVLITHELFKILVFQVFIWCCSAKNVCWKPWWSKRLFGVVALQLVDENQTIGICLETFSADKKVDN